jgi:hypothetical protein
MMRRGVVGTMFVVAVLSVLLAGVAWAKTITGTSGNDVLVGTSRGDTIRGLQGTDRIDGGAGPDVLQGNENDDRLVGGPGDDVLGGGRGEDALCGGAGDDGLKESLIRGAGGFTNNGITVFYFGSGWGQDSIGKPEGSRTDLDTIEFVNSEDSPVEFCDSLVTSNLDIDLVEARATDGTNTLRWSPFTIEIIRSGDGDDGIVAGRGGPYTIYSNAGNDTIDVSGNGEKEDQVGCGSGIDTVVADPSDETRDLGGGFCENVTVVP